MQGLSGVTYVSHVRVRQQGGCRQSGQGMVNG